MLAEEAAAAGDHEGNHHPVAGTHSGHLAADLLDNAHEFVAQNVTGLHRRDFAMIKVQV